MKALSLTRPWPYTILHLGKRIENRSHAQFSRFRGPLLLHAAKSWDDTCQRFVLDRGLGGRGLAGAAALSQRADHPTGIVGRCRVVGHVDGASDDVWVSRPGQPQTLEDVDQAQALCETLVWRWWMGGHGIVLADVEALPEPIPCNGRLGLWTVPPEVVAQLPTGWRHQHEAAR